MNMDIGTVLGFLGVGFSFASFLMKSMRPLRAIALVSNVCFIAYLLVQRLREFKQLGRPGDIEVPGAAHGNGFQALVAHDYADAAGRAGVIVVDGSHVDPVFAGEADGRHLDALVLQFLFQQVLRFAGAFAPQVRCIAYFIASSQAKTGRQKEMSRA